MAHSANVAHGTNADATRHARPRGRAACGPRKAQVARGGANAWQGPRESTWAPGCRHVAGGLVSGGPTVIVLGW